MPLHRLTDTVLRRGCGTNLAAVLASQEYADLRKEAHALGLVAPDDSALVQMLGQKLAERAFQNVPQALRSQLHTWHNGYVAQLKLLDLIRGALHGSNWRASGNRNYAYNSDVRCVLPAETGSWEEGPVQPNCLGMAQMAMGIFQHLGAEYYLANTLRANQDTLHSWELKTLGITTTTLRSFAGTDDLAVRMEVAYRSALKKSTSESMAHHVVIVKTDDGAWWVVDPYLDALYPLSGSEECSAGLASLARARNKMFVVSNPNSVLDDYLAKLQMMINVVHFMGTIVEEVSKDQCPIEPLEPLSYAAAHAWLGDGPTGDRAEFNRYLALLPATQLDEDSEYPAVAQLALLYAMGDTEDLAEVLDIMGEATEASVAHIDAGMQRASKDNAYRLHVAGRLVRFALKHLMEELDGLAAYPETRHHECLEIGWAAMVLGIATLNHMQFEEPVGTPTLRGLLWRLLHSQWAMYDALVIAQERGEPLGPDDLASSKEYLRRFSNTPEALIVPLFMMTRGTA